MEVEAGDEQPHREDENGDRQPHLQGLHETVGRPR